MLCAGCASIGASRGTFHDRVSCAAYDGAVVDRSATYPLVQPNRAFARLNSAMRAWAVSLVQVDHCEPKPVRVNSSRPDDEIFTDCQITHRSKDVANVLCKTGWNGTVLGVHPDGRPDVAIFRLADGSRLSLDEIVDERRAAELRKRLRDELAANWSEETEGYDEEGLEDLAGELAATAHVTAEGLAFATSRYPHRFELLLRLEEARRFLHPSFLEAIASR